MNIDLLIVDIIEETNNTRSFILKDINSKIITFTPGQYITLKLRFEGETLVRSYSISSIPEMLPLLRITIKHNYNSPSYTEFSQTLRIGDIITAETIEGNFYISEKEFINSYLFIAAGSGITPIISMINSLLMKSNNIKVKLLYQNRNEELVIFYDEIIKLSKKHENFDVEFYFSKPLKLDKESAKRINPDILSVYYLKNREVLNNSEIFVCGPNQLIDMVFSTFKEFGFRENRLHREIFEKKEDFDNSFITKV